MIVFWILPLVSVATTATAPLAQFIHRQTMHSTRLLEANVMANGAVRASPSSANPNYSYHWVRDAATSMMHFVRNSKPQHRKNVPNRSGGLGEPKFNLDGSAFDDEWGRPQDDGPALRALTLIQFSNAFLDHGGLIGKIQEELLYVPDLKARSTIKVDLEYVAKNWQQDSVELWEEARGHHLYTRAVQRAALYAGADFAFRMNDTAASKYYRNTAYSIHQAIQRDHWNKESYYLLSTVDWKGGPLGKTSLLDVSAILAAVHTRYIPVLHQNIIAIDSGELLLTALQLAWRMQELYFINHHVQRESHEYLKLIDNTRENLLSEEQLPIGPGIGRYTEDTYDGYRTDSLGNPWFLATNAFAELSFAVAHKWCLSRSIPTGQDQYLGMAVDWILKGGLMGQLNHPPSQNQTIRYNMFEPPMLFNAVIGNLTLAGDAFIRRIAKHVPQFPGEYGDTIGSMSEQFNRDTGFMQGAVELTWSHASFLSMVRQRNITKGMRVNLPNHCRPVRPLHRHPARSSRDSREQMTVTKKKDVATPTAVLPNGAKVSGPLSVSKILVGISGANAEWVGVDEKEKAAVEKQIEEALALHKTLLSDKKDAALAALNKTLSTKVFICGNHLTLADFFLYASLYTLLPKPASKLHLARESSKVTLTDMVDFELDVPCEDIGLMAEAPKKKADPAAKEGEKKSAAPAGEKKAKEEKKGGKEAATPKEKKAEKAEKPAKEAAAPKAEAVEENLKAEPERLDLRVGHVTSVKRHPDAETLYVEEIEVGEEKPRTVVSGLVKYMKEEDLLNRKVVLLCNLKPAKMRGIESQAMVLAATSVDGTTVELLDAPASAKSGDRCWFDGHRGTDFSQLNAKKKTWETVQPRLKTDGFKQAVYSVAEAGVTLNSVLRCSEGEIVVKTVTGASIK
ncbi:Six-hairpin glycosidase [Rhizoclosmatium globosum]|uniref:glucan 1,4-alpha-glucosidase n=1 Tax=Rhizoclosmatium globosum TaxID=329046 RepID=A0A1Y2CMC3_9FUNG|nr:Six-hairpin glycosidase [Rhizoclosmatium globosum]|eukprot:ORY48188.1 Six-hairpin glycosidase [Rhizoclosmatium globosum]